MASILPNQIPPETTPLLGPDGKSMSHNWWLWGYNINQAVLGNSGTTAATFAAQTNADIDTDVETVDALGLAQRVENLEKRMNDEYPLVTETFRWIPDELVPDPIPRAQPAQVITVGGSPFVFTAYLPGVLIVTAGTVSDTSLSRDGITFYSVTGAIPMSRLDQVRITYSATPTVVFLPS